MSDQTPLPSPDEPPHGIPPYGAANPVEPPHDGLMPDRPLHDAPPKPPQRGVLPLLYAAGFVILAVAIIYLWQNPGVPNETAANTQALQVVQQHLSEVSNDVSKLEQRPVPDTSKIAARLDALEHKVADLAEQGSRVDAVSARIESLAGRDQTAIDALKQQNQTAADALKHQLDALTGQVTALEGTAGNVQAITTRLTRVAKLQEAAFALEAGRPVGDVPGAPAALAQYARVAPPTQGQLLLRFHDSEQAALAVPPPGDASPSFAERAWDRAQGLMTIRRGNDVVVGNSVAMTLNKAQAALDVGDLAGAVSVVETLKGAPAEAMTGWLQDAKGLLAARAALDQMAGQA